MKNSSEDQELSLPEQRLFKECVYLIDKDFFPVLLKPFDEVLTSKDFAQVSSSLVSVVFGLLKSNFAALKQLAYRVDIPEFAFNEALATKDLETSAKLLAEHILQREKLKAITRLSYSS